MNQKRKPEVPIIEQKNVQKLGGLMIKYKLSRTMLLLMESFIFLNIMDSYTTYVLLGLGGQELNPLFSYFNLYGVDIISVLLYKIALPLFECVVIYVLFQKAKSENNRHVIVLVWGCLITLVLLTLITSVNNILHTTYQLQEINQILTELGIWSV